ncbi:hypothetical protein BB560_000681 [Smittium megazygosporum]|uniref:Scaffold protein Nfu/NifU N-terminal domain-containing protein n=1 Tax=Smittium megazygosporum TaxID=133381 RepID=A0A2T9ZJV8_9FUNG|nr:hypothetical protein BB560_000681 [Smittium megazygosporum]
MFSSKHLLSKSVLFGKSVASKSTLSFPNTIIRNSIPSSLISHLQRRSLFIQTEQTPNENALKFIPGTEIIQENEKTLEVKSRKEAIGNPFATKIFGIPGIETLFFGKDFITIVKDPDYKWQLLKPELLSIMMEYFSTNQPILTDKYREKMTKPTQPENTDIDTNEIVAEIKELLDTRIRPSIIEDGGDLEFIGFDIDTGILRVSLHGACRGCSSSEVTLKNGIESMLKYYIPEVSSVESVQTELEALNVSEFEKFESKLKKLP